MIKINTNIVKVNGVNEYFCDITFVTELHINDVKREDFPRNIHWLISEIRERKKQSVLTKKYSNDMSLLMLNIGNLYNCVDELYGLKKVFSQTRKSYLLLPRKFEEDFNTIIKYIPNKYIIKTEYIPCIIHKPLKSVCFTIVKIKPQALSYLKQSKQPKKFDKIIKVIETMNKQSKKDVDFDKYLDDWCKKLLKEIQ